MADYPRCRICGRPTCAPDAVTCGRTCCLLAYQAWKFDKAVQRRRENERRAMERAQRGQRFTDRQFSQG